jgi:histidinol-phosphatase
MDDLGFAHRLAGSADEVTRAAFAARDFAVRYKDDGTAVTDVDVAVEQALERHVAATHPSDAFLSEELGAHGESSRTWIVDGIDGTEVFARGGPGWGTLVALLQDDEVVVGVASSPGLRRRWWASRGAGAWTAPLTSPPTAAEPTRLTVSDRGRDPRWTVVPPPEKLDGWRQLAARRRAESFRATETGGHGPLLVAAGDLDASLLLYGGPWDYAPFVVLVEEAGGRFSDLWGGRRIDTRTAIYSNRLVHDVVRSLVAPLAPASPTERSGSQ